MISILLPSRGRPPLLQRFIQSVAECRVGPVEIIVRLDDDDTALYNAELLESPLVLVLTGPSGAGMGAMTNECLRLAQGDIIMLAGDDLVIGTPGFDALVREAMPEDGVGLVFGNDGLQGPNLATHPFIGRAAINAWGGKVVPDEYRAEFIDTHIMDTFGRLGRLGHRRITYLPDLVTEHMHHLNGKAPLDATYGKAMPFRESALVYEGFAAKRQKDAEAMKRKIEENFAWA